VLFHQVRKLFKDTERASFNRAVHSIGGSRQGPLLRRLFRVFSLAQTTSAYPFCFRHKARATFGFIAVAAALAVNDSGKRATGAVHFLQIVY